jgi:hypothetical protein
MHVSLIKIFDVSVQLCSFMFLTVLSAEFGYCHGVEGFSVAGDISENFTINANR